MWTVEELRRRVEGAEDLHSITRAMKALAAVRIRKSREAVASLEDYARTVELALQALLRHRPEGTKLAETEFGPGTGAVVFGSDLGLAGRFNVRIADFALKDLAELEPRREKLVVLAVGSRVAAQLEAQQQPVVRRFPAPDSVEALAPTVQDLLVAIEEVRAQERLERFHLYYNHYHSGATYRPAEIQLLPLHVEWLRGLENRTWPTSALPTFRLPWRELFAESVREHLYVSIYGAAARSQAAENASRLASMEAAERRIEERLTELRGRFNQQRQQGITEELLDLVIGYLALEDEEG